MAGDVIHFVAALAKANKDNLMVGKTRYQKTAYLLEAMDLGIGLDFDYHHYGPFSADLAFAVDDACGFGMLQTEEKNGYHSVPYTIYHATDTAPAVFPDGRDEERKTALRKISRHSAIVLELASTADYLRRYEGFGNPWPEVRIRKTLKATDDRIEAAQRLLSDLGLPA